MRGVLIVTAGVAHAALIGVISIAAHTPRIWPGMALGLIGGMIGAAIATRGTHT